ncbi:MAG: valine--tRNA ligase [Actinomycetota bacterium]|nr:valine--tRNA ligase [Actinomycetota bacterium]
MIAAVRQTKSDAQESMRTPVRSLRITAADSTVTGPPAAPKAT